MSKIIRLHETLYTVSEARGQLGGIVIRQIDGFSARWFDTPRSLKEWMRS